MDIGGDVTRRTEGRCVRCGRRTWSFVHAVSRKPFEGLESPEFVGVACYHFATQLVSTARDEIERDNYREV